MSAMSRTAVAVLVVALLFTLACGGGGSSSSATPPVFSLSAPGAASEGASFTYTLQASDPKGGSVSFAIVSAPTGATLSGATISWTPTHAQSRQPNEFTVKATSSSGGTATASFTVTPAGTVRGTQIATYWSNGTPTQVPADLSLMALKALVPDGNGGYVTCAGQGASDGTFSIPNVPAGYYWLLSQSMTASASTYYWSNSNDIDLGSDFSGHPHTISTGLPPGTTVTGNFNVSGMDPWSNWMYLTPPPANYSYSGLIGVSPEAAAEISVLTTDTTLGLPSQPIIADGATSCTGQLSIIARPFPIEASAGDNTYILQTNTSRPSGSFQMNGWTIGSVTKFLGPLQLTMDSNTSTVDIDGEFAAANPASARFKIKAAGFASAIAATNSNAGNAAGQWFGPGPQLGAKASVTPVPSRYAPPQIAFIFPGSLGGGLTGDTLASVYNSGQIADYDSGDVSFVNPFAAPAQLVYNADQYVYVPIYQSGNAGFAGVGITGYMTTTAPTADKPFDLPMGNVQTPQINGANLFQTTNVSQPVQLSWSAPTGLTPSGYEIRIAGYKFSTTCPGQPTGPSFCVEFVSNTRLFTTNTSVSLPSGVLQDGVQYVFTIRALADAATDFLKAPFRGSWNRAYSDVISNLITVGTAPAPASTPAVRTNSTGTSKHVLMIQDSNGGVQSFYCTGEGVTNCTW